jgi:outer membrane protein assembly factor BamD (BamD/ComL family)
MEEEQLYQLGLAEFDARDWGDAIRALDRYLVSFANGERVADARLLLAKAYFGKGDLLTARSEFQRFLDRFPGHAEAPSAALGICTSLVRLSPKPERDQSYTREAIANCSSSAAPTQRHDGRAARSSESAQASSRIAVRPIRP